MIPTARVVGACVLFVVLTLYAATSEVTWLFLLALWMLALVPAAFVYAVWNQRGVTLSLAVREVRPAPGSPLEELPESVLRRSPQLVPVFEGDDMGIAIGLRARSGRRGPAWAAGEVGGSKLGAGTGVVTRDGWWRVVWAHRAARGGAYAGGWAIGTSDPLGMFRGLRRVSDTELALVLPRFTSFGHTHQAREVEASLAAPRAGSGNELFGIREYRPGDSLRRIHWRSSARHGELVVREYEPPGVQVLTIAVDPRPPTGEIADQVARIAASEAWDCLREGGRVAIGGALETRDIWEVLEWLARYPAGPVDVPEFPGVVVSADPGLLAPQARTNWLIGDARIETDIPFRRVGVTWPL